MPETTSVVFHIAELARAQAGFNNLKNLLATHAFPLLEIVVICTADSVQSLTKSSDIAWPILLAAGVRIYACENSLRGQNIATTELLSNVTTVPVGVVELINKQQQGYSYIRP